MAGEEGVLPVMDLPARRLPANLGTEPRLRHLNEHLFANMRHARSLIAAWRDNYNHHRPHTSLDGLTPWECERYLNRDSYCL